MSLSLYMYSVLVAVSSFQISAVIGLGLRELSSSHHRLTYDNNIIHDKHVYVRNNPGEALEFNIQHFDRDFDLVLHPDYDVISTLNPLKHDIHYDSYYVGTVKGDKDSLVMGGLDKGIFIGLIRVKTEHYSVEFTMAGQDEPVHSYIFNLRHINRTEDENILQDTSRRYPPQHRGSIRGKQLLRRQKRHGWGKILPGRIEGNVECPMVMVYDHYNTARFSQLKDEDVRAKLGKKVGVTAQYINQAVGDELKPRHQGLKWTVLETRVHFPSECWFDGHRIRNRDERKYNLCKKRNMCQTCNLYTRFIPESSCLSVVYVGQDAVGDTRGVCCSMSRLDNNDEGFCAHNIYRNVDSSSAYSSTMNGVAVNSYTRSGIQLEDSAVRVVTLHEILHSFGCRHVTDEACKGYPVPANPTVMDAKLASREEIFDIGECCGYRLTRKLDVTITGQFGRTNCFKARCTFKCQNGGWCVMGGTCQCTEGFKGTRCELDDEGIDSPKKGCSPKCVNGVCKWGICRCLKKWTGRTCNSTICTIICFNGGICSGESNRCQCQTHYFSTRCEKFKCPEPCENGGVCFSPEKGCTCKKDWMGSNCTEPRCDPKCENGGTCVSANLCKCTSQWTGNSCQTPTICNPPCGKNGRCEGISCHCDAGYSGLSCEKFTCSQGCGRFGACTGPDKCTCDKKHTGLECQKEGCDKKCKNYGVCKLRPGSSEEYCECKFSYEGDLCETFKCKPECLNGGDCKSDIRACKCVPDFYGVACEFELDKTKVCESGGKTADTGLTAANLMADDNSCDPPCMNHGSCIKSVCTCLDGYSGDKCQTFSCMPRCAKDTGTCVGPDLCLCEVGWNEVTCGRPMCQSPCENGGECIEPNLCECQPGYEGTFCNEVMCSPACENNGRCESPPNNCKCSDVYEGPTCSEPICPKGCGTNGTCSAPNICTCPDDYRGDVCDEPVCSVVCQNNGTCTAPDVCDCSALNGYDGDYCEIIVCDPPCRDGVECIAPDKCDCQYPWIGKSCEVYETTQAPPTTPLPPTSSPTGSFTSHCGNNVIEDYEECDCGKVEDCGDDCCFGSGTGFGNDCKFKKTAICSQADPCCKDDCTIQLLNWIVCEEETACKLPATCDGYHKECPEPKKKPDGTLCSTEEGDMSSICRNGLCTNMCQAIGWDDCYDAVSAKLEEVVNVDTFCYMACRNPETRECISTQHLDVVKKKAHFLFASITNHHQGHSVRRPFGDKCHNATFSYCDIFHKCQLKTGFGPQNYQLLDTQLTRNAVYDNFTLPAIVQMKTWIKDNWWKFLIVTTCAIALVTVFMVFLVRSTPLGMLPQVMKPSNGDSNPGNRPSAPRNRPLSYSLCSILY